MAKRVYRKKSFKKKSYKRKSTRKISPMKRLIRKEISRSLENKCAQQYVYDRVLSPSSSADFETQNILILGPDPGSFQIQQGVGQGERIGNTITTKKFVVRGTFVPLPFDTTVNPAPAPVQMKVWIFYDKEEPSSIPSPKGSSNFFQNGNTSKGFQNDLVDLWSPVNTDRYRVLTTKTFKLGFADYSGTGGTVPSSQNNQFYANNDFKFNCNFSFDLTKHYPKIVKFNDNSATPTSRGLFMLIQYVRADGGLINSSYRQVGMQYMQDYHYEDA